MDDGRKTNEASDQLLDRVMQQISADKVTTHSWNTWSLVLIYSALVTVIVLELENVNVGIVTAVAVSSLLAFLILNRVHRKKLEKQSRENKIDGYRKFLLRGTHRGEDGAAAIETTLSRREIQILHGRLVDGHDVRPRGQRRASDDPVSVHAGRQAPLARVHRVPGSVRDHRGDGGGHDPPALHHERLRADDA